jgi:hypothetical protein
MVKFESSTWQNQRFHIHSLEFHALIVSMHFCYLETIFFLWVMFLFVQNLFIFWHKIWNFKISPMWIPTIGMQLWIGLQFIYNSSIVLNKLLSHIWTSFVNQIFVVIFLLLKFHFININRNNWIVFIAWFFRSYMILLKRIKSPLINIGWEVKNLFIY